jgi:hypothetical protein
MTKPEEPGSRDTGSDLPSGGPTDRPSGAYKGDESVPQHGEAEKPDFETGFTTEPPHDVKPEIPPYEGRKTSADSGETTEKAGARTGGATAPTTDPDYKSPAPGDTAGGTTASPPQGEPAGRHSAPDSGDDMVGPAHTPGTGRGEQKR